MKYGLTVLTMTIGFLLETTLLQHMRILGAIPNLALVLVVVFSIRYEMPIAICSAVAGGILQDFFFSPAFGMYMLIYLTIAVSVSAISGNFFEESGVTPIVMIAFSTVCQYSVMIVIYYFAGMQFDLSSIILRLILPELALNIVFCWIAYKFIGNIIVKYGTAGGR
ncbi:MAG: rod shape-determining protein MreD [Peptostreptococcaceae bacterium]|nr:rod shape-determining protein MreD [Peptostreptococcaceae bacterium]